MITRWFKLPASSWPVHTSRLVPNILGGSVQGAVIRCHRTERDLRELIYLISGSSFHKGTFLHCHSVPSQPPYYSVQPEPQLTPARPPSSRSPTHFTRSKCCRSVINRNIRSYIHCREFFPSRLSCKTIHEQQAVEPRAGFPDTWLAALTAGVTTETFHWWVVSLVSIGRFHAPSLLVHTNTAPREKILQRSSGCPTTGGVTSKGGKRKKRERFLLAVRCLFPQRRAPIGWAGFLLCTDRTGSPAPATC